MKIAVEPMTVRFLPFNRRLHQAKLVGKYSTSQWLASGYIRPWCLALARPVCVNTNIVHKGGFVYLRS